MPSEDTGFYVKCDKVSILLAVYNGAEWLEQAIASVAGQSHSNWELIVVDNGSEDGSFGIAQHMAAQDPRVRAYRLPEKGKNLAYNHAYLQSGGDFIAFFAADDILPAESLRKRVAPLVGCFGLAYSTCVLKTISEDPKFDGVVIPRDRERPNFSGGAMMFSRDLADRIFPIPLSLPNEDTWTQLHLRAFAKNSHVPEILYHYRIHGRNSFGYHASFRVKRDGFIRRARAHELFLERYGALAGENEFIRENVANFVCALEALRQGKVFRALVSTRLPVAMKVLLVYYSSPLLFRLRNVLFRLMSGRFVQN